MPNYCVDCKYYDNSFLMTHTNEGEEQHTCLAPTVIEALCPVTKRLINSSGADCFEVRQHALLCIFYKEKE